METKDFTGFNIPDSIDDPEEREFLELVNRVIVLALKKDYTLALLARIDERENITVVTGYSHCFEFLLGKVMEKTPQLEDILLSAVIRNKMDTMKDELKNKQDTAGKDPVTQQLINYAKKNTPTGN